MRLEYKCFFFFSTVLQQIKNTHISKTRNSRTEKKKEKIQTMTRISSIVQNAIHRCIAQYWRTTRFTKIVALTLKKCSHFSFSSFFAPSVFLGFLYILWLFFIFCLLQSYCGLIISLLLSQLTNLKQQML